MVAYALWRTPPPPLARAKAFSPFGCGRIFPLFSRVMRVGLSTGPCAERPESVLSGLIFSKADDCADLVLSFKALNMNGYFQRFFWSVFENVRLADRTGIENHSDFPVLTQSSSRRKGRIAAGCGRGTAPEKSVDNCRSS